MYCQHCGENNEEQAKFCKNCGQPLDSRNAGEQTGGNANYTRGINGKPYNQGDSDATIAMVFGIISLVMCSSSLLSIGLGIAAVILANKAQKLGSASGNIQTAKICGIIGIALGGICTLFYLFSFMFGIFAGVWRA